MSEQRFTVQEDANSDKILLLIDNEQMKMWSFLAEEREAVKKIVDLLNELSEENEQLRKVCSYLKKENQSLIENIFDIYEKVKWVVR